MTSEIFGRIDLWARNLTPFALTLLLVLLSVVPLPIRGYAQVSPALVLAAVYFWSIHRPDLLPAPAVFAAGLTFDLLSGAPVGMTALVLLLTHSVVVSQRRFFLGKSFLVAWWGFMMVAVAAMAAVWILAMIMQGQLLDPLPTVFRYLLTLCLYPALAVLFVLAQRSFLRQK